MARVVISHTAAQGLGQPEQWVTLQPAEQGQLHEMG